VHHQQEHHAARDPQCLPPLFAFHGLVRPADVQWIVENEARVVERNAVLGEVGRRLGRIPREAHAEQIHA
jgi:hypothetical protein